MNNKKPSKSDESLSTILRKWKVDATLPPRFQEQVWKQIADKEKAVAPSLWALLRLWMEATLTRPVFVASYMAALLLLGVTIGHEQGQTKIEQARSELQTRYIQMVDPYQAPR